MVGSWFIFNKTKYYTYGIEDQVIVAQKRIEKHLEDEMRSEARTILSQLYYIW